MTGGSKEPAEIRAQQLFEARYGGVPDGISSAPGRVNLIGDHTDYAGGLVLPAALRVQTAVAYRVTDKGRVQATSESFPDDSGFEPGELGVAGWGGYLAGVAWALLESGVPLSGLELAICSDVPTGAGLSSSAALEVAMARVWREVDGLALDDVALAKLCKRAENDYVGVPSGIMDQFASSVPEPGEVLLLDCFDLGYEVLAVPAGWSFVVVDSGASRSLAGSAYAVRVAECAQIADVLGLTSLRELQTENLRNLTGDLLKRARHILTENQRVEAAAASLQLKDRPRFGRLMNESHRSLRDEYEVSSPALDTLVKASLSFEGCYGARLTGAGFGGCTVQLLETGAEEAFAEYLQKHLPQAKIVAAV